MKRQSVARALDERTLTLATLAQSVRNAWNVGHEGLALEQCSQLAEVVDDVRALLQRAGMNRHPVRNVEVLEGAALRSTIGR